MIEDALLLERALALFLRYGIKRTSLEAIAEAAGTTRVTLYRRFSDKETLLREALLYGVRRFEEGLGGIDISGEGGVENALEGFARLFAEGPLGSLGSLREELTRLYPSLYREILEAQQATGRSFFRRLVEEAERVYEVRRDADPELLYTVFETLLRHLPEDPALKRTEGNPGELFSRTVRLLLFGIVENS